MRDQTATPIKHLVVIFQENVSFDHYFGTYPNAANTGGQPFTRGRARRRSTGSAGDALLDRAHPNRANPNAAHARQQPDRLAGTPAAS